MTGANKIGYYEIKNNIKVEVIKMAVKIRLTRMGAKKKPFYRIVVADSRTPRDGRAIQEIGFYDPTAEPALLKVDTDAAGYWLSKGAQPTDTVRALLKRAGVQANAKGVKKSEEVSKPDDETPAEPSDASE